MDFFLVLSYQGGGPPVSLAMKRPLEVARYVWVLNFVNLLTVCYNKFAPVVSTSFFSLCGRINFLHFEFLTFFRVNFLYWKVIFPSLCVN